MMYLSVKPNNHLIIMIFLKLKVISYKHKDQILLLNYTKTMVRLYYKICFLHPGNIIFLVTQPFCFSGLMQDALRVCQEYMPNKLDELREELTRGGAMNDNKMGSSSGNRPTTAYNNEGVLEQAARCESQGDYQRAVDLYLRLMPQQDIPKETLIKSYLKASDLARKFLPESKAQHVIRTIGPRLVQLGSPNQAAEQYLHVELHKEAVEAFIAGKQWEKAKKLALEIDPQLAKYVDDLYKKHLKERGNARELINVDVTAALDLFVEKNQWEECFVEAQKHGPLVLHSYLAKYAAQMIQANRAELAATVYKQYGAIAIPQNLRIYKALFYRMLRIDSLKHENYSKWADVRDVLHDVFENMTSSASGGAGGIQKEIEEQRPTFEILLW
jgi:intraflagellar transport protein 172